jgi:dihydroorotate dehydrogenase
LKHREEVDHKIPIFVKIAPDLSEQDLQDITFTVLDRTKKYHIDGLIVSNTTIRRDESLQSEFKNENGGLSGAPLKKMANEMTKRVYQLTQGKITIIGVGGIESGEDALERIKNGASLVQIYTSMIYNGPYIADTIKRELVALLKYVLISNLDQFID